MNIRARKGLIGHVVQWCHLLPGVLCVRNVRGATISRGNNASQEQGSRIPFQPGSAGAPSGEICSVPWYTIASGERISLFHKNQNLLILDHPTPILLMRRLEPREVILFTQGGLYLLLTQSE